MFFPNLVDVLLVSCRPDSSSSVSRVPPALPSFARFSAQGRNLSSRSSGGRRSRCPGESPEASPRTSPAPATTPARSRSSPPLPHPSARGQRGGVRTSAAGHGVVGLGPGGASEGAGAAGDVAESQARRKMRVCLLLAVHRRERSPGHVLPGAN
eukprot:149991-Hanusia_phi.AAC.1